MSFDPDVTDMVATWIISESDFLDHNGAHKRIAEHAYDYVGANNLDGLRSFTTQVLRQARGNSAAREVADELSANDYDRIKWSEVAAALRASNG